MTTRARVLVRFRAPLRTNTGKVTSGETLIIPNVAVGSVVSLVTDPKLGVIEEVEQGGYSVFHTKEPQIVGVSW